MISVLTTATVAPLLATPTLRGEQVSQLVLGEGGEVMAAQGPMLRIRTCLEGYEGWVHQGYVAKLARPEVEAWLASAAWSEGALLEDDHGIAIRAPHRARLVLAGERHVRLPNGESAEVLAGEVRNYLDLVTEAQKELPAEWAWREFAGTPYQWGGVTGAGIDCSALVQTTFLARGITLPRDSRAQVGQGSVVDLHDRQPGDVLFFHAPESEKIEHVAILAADDTIVHSTVELGGVVREPWGEGSRAASLRTRLASIRRLT